MMSIRPFILGASLAFALMAGCKSSTVADVKQAAGDEACNKGCEDTQKECVEQCAQDVNKDVCEITCKEAHDKCNTECKEKNR